MPKTKIDPRFAELQRKMPRITDEHGVRRFIALLFGFCARCENRHCRRADNCVGETASCFHALWPTVPEIEKDLFRAMIRARQAGATTPEQIKERAIAAVMEQYKTAERLAAPQRETPQTPPPREPILPRARIL